MTTARIRCDGFGTWIFGFRLVVSFASFAANGTSQLVTFDQVFPLIGASDLGLFWNFPL